jgi:hypothetical protein
VNTLLFGHKNKLQIDLGDLHSEKDSLSSFLQATFKAPVTSVGTSLVVESEKASSQELQRVLTKFIYKRNINNMYYVSVDGSTVKVNTFKGSTKKPEKPKKNATHQTAVQSWGL